MNTKKTMKSMIAAGLAVTMLAGGGATALANGNGKGNGNGKDQGRNNDNKYTTQAKNISNSKGNVNIVLNFPDVTGADVEWAMKYIASLASKRVFEGYEDGSFQPRKTITRIEALTAAVRLMGLRDQAESAEEMNSNLNFKDADHVKKQYAWATGYVAVAAENDLFLESDDKVQPDKPADRLWATTLLVKAMKLGTEAKSKMNEKLTFRDAAQIPAGSVGYVKVALEKGLIDGYEDNTFRPDRPVTRAELAALLDRTGEQLPGNGSGQDQTLVTGKLAAAPVGNVLQVENNGQYTNVVVDANAFIYRNNARVALNALVAGDTLKIRTFNGIALFVEVTTAVTNPSFSVTGLYKDMTLTAEGKIATIKIAQTVSGTVQEAVYNVAPTVSITGGSLPAADRLIELKGSNALVTEIKIY
ncbi:MAG: S-layer protein [Paenibacillaceae bacterium]|nr:S-layer protein [Paenibacillaceae bacterium]